MVSPLLALCALAIFFRGLDFDEDLAIESELVSLVNRSSGTIGDDFDDAASDDSQTSLDSWSAHDLGCEFTQSSSLPHPDGRAGGGERPEGKRAPSGWLTARLSLWNVAGFVVVVGTELPHGLVATGSRVVAISRQCGLIPMPPVTSVATSAPSSSVSEVLLGDVSGVSGAAAAAFDEFSGGLEDELIAMPAPIDAAASAAAAPPPAPPAGIGPFLSVITASVDSPSTAMDVMWRAARAELPDDLYTLAAATLVVMLTFCALQLTSWRPRSGWVWLPGGGGGAAIGLLILAIAPRAFLPSSLLFLCAVSASELFTISEHADAQFAVDASCGGLRLRSAARWVPPRLFAALAAVVWLVAVMRVLLSHPPSHPAAWSGSKPLYAAEMQLLLAAWWACGSCERERGSARTSVVCRALLPSFRTLLHFALAARVLAQLLLPADFSLAVHSVHAAVVTVLLSLLVALTCTRGAAEGALAENVTKLTECGLLLAAACIVSLPLIRHHVLPALMDAPHTLTTNDALVFCACLLAVLAHLSTRVRGGGAPILVSVGTWVGAIGLALHATTRQPAAGSHALNAIIVAAVLSALRRLPTMPSTGRANATGAAALVVGCLLFAAQSAALHAPANAVNAAHARAARSAPTAAALAAQQQPVAAAAGAAPTATAVEATAAGGGSASGTSSDVVEGSSPAGGTGPTGPAAAAGASDAPAMVAPPLKATAEEVAAAAAAGASHFDGIALAAAVGVGYATSVVPAVGAPDPPWHTAVLFSMHLPHILRACARLSLPSACAPLSLATGVLGALLALPAIAVFVCKVLRSGLMASGARAAGSAIVDDDGEAAGHMTGGCLSVLVAGAMHLRFVVLLFFSGDGGDERTDSGGDHSVGLSSSSDIDADPHLLGCLPHEAAAVRSPLLAARVLLASAEGPTLIASIVLTVLCLGATAHTWRVHATTAGHDRAFSLVVHSLAALGPALLLPMGLLPLSDDSLFSGVLFSAASLGRVAAIFLAADGALTERPYVQAALLLLGGGVAAALSRLLEGGLTAGGLLHLAPSDASALTANGDGAAALDAAANATAAFSTRSEFDAFAAALPAAAGLVALGGMSAFVGEVSHDWRDGWGMWAAPPRLYAWRALRLAPTCVRLLLLLGFLPASDDADALITSLSGTLLPPALSLAALCLALVGLRANNSATRTRKWIALAYLLGPSNAWFALLTRPALAAIAALAAALIPALIDGAATLFESASKRPPPRHATRDVKTNSASAKKVKAAMTALAEAEAEAAAAAVVGAGTTSAGGGARRRHVSSTVGAAGDKQPLTTASSGGGHKGVKAAQPHAPMAHVPPAPARALEVVAPPAESAGAKKKKGGKATATVPSPATAVTIKTTTLGGGAAAAATRPTPAPVAPSAVNPIPPEDATQNDDAAPTESVPTMASSSATTVAKAQPAAVASRDDAPVATAVDEGTGKDEAVQSEKAATAEEPAPAMAMVESDDDDAEEAIETAGAAATAATVRGVLDMKRAERAEDEAEAAAELAAAAAAEAAANVVLAAAAAEEEEAEAAAEAAAEAGARAHAEAVVAADAAQAAAAKARAEARAAEEAEAAAAAMRAADEARIRAIGPGLPPPPARPFGVGLPPPPSALFGLGGLSSVLGGLPGLPGLPPPPGGALAAFGEAAAADKLTAASADDDEPADYVCPITHEVMSDPVVTADGQSYERNAIEQWLRHSTLSPLTNEPLAHLNLTPNMALRRLIREWIAQREAANKATGRESHSHSRRGRRGGQANHNAAAGEGGVRNRAGRGHAAGGRPAGGGGRGR